MVALAIVLVILAIVLAGEIAEARFQRRHDVAGYWPDSVRAPLPDPLVPSTIQRSSGGG